MVEDMDQSIPDQVDVAHNSISTLGSDHPSTSTEYISPDISNPTPNTSDDLVTIPTPIPLWRSQRVSKDPFCHVDYVTKKTSAHVYPSGDHLSYKAISFAHLIRQYLLLTRLTLVLCPILKSLSHTRKLSRIVDG